MFHSNTTERQKATSLKLSKNLDIRLTVRKVGLRKSSTALLSALLSSLAGKQLRLIDLSRLPTGRHLIGPFRMSSHKPYPATTKSYIATLTNPSPSHQSVLATHRVSEKFSRRFLLVILWCWGLVRLSHRITLKIRYWKMSLNLGHRLMH